jgi:hypothetical protein
MNLRILCTALLLIAGPALSAELDYALRGGVTYSDNVERLPDGLERSSTAAVVGFELHGDKPAGRLRYDIAADLAYNEYLNLGLDSEVFGRVGMLGSYDFVPDTFTWNASIGYEPIRADSFRPLAPGNTEDQLSLATGPTLRARFSAMMGAELDMRYSRISYSDRPFDNETVGARAMLVRRANPRSMLALGASYDDVSHVSGAVPPGLDFNRRELFARIELAGVRTNLDLETGYADINGESYDDAGAMLRAHLSRRMTPALTGFVRAVREYPTSEDVARSSDSLSVVVGGYNRSEFNSGPRQSTSIEGGLRYERPRVDGELGYLHREDDSLAGVAAEHKFDEFRASASRRFTPGVRGTLYGTLTNEDISGLTGGNVDERALGARLGISIGRSLGLDLQIEHRKRDGITALDGYSELGGGIFLRYSGSTGADAAR